MSAKVLELIDGEIKRLTDDVEKWRDEAGWAEKSKNLEIHAASIVFRSAESRKRRELSAWLALKSAVEKHHIGNNEAENHCFRCFIEWPCSEYEDIVACLGVEP